MVANYYTLAKRVLIIEDDAVTRLLVHRHLTRAGFHARGAQSTEHAFSLIDRYGLPHLAVVDIHLPGASGIEFCRRISAMADLPILIMTDRSNYDAALSAFERYADDFVLKPLDVNDLLARTVRIMRRIPSFDYAEDHALCVDDGLKINLIRHRIEVDGREIPLTPIESKLLSVLLRNVNRPLTQQTLIDCAWPDSDVSEDALRVQIHRLRRKVRSKRTRFNYIQTERGIGYRFVVRDSTSMRFRIGA